MSDTEERPSYFMPQKGSLGWHKEKFSFEVAMLEPGPEADELYEVLQQILKMT